LHLSVRTMFQNVCQIHVPTLLISHARAWHESIGLNENQVL
jgi:hypothetical protein